MGTKLGINRSSARRAPVRAYPILIWGSRLFLSAGAAVLVAIGLVYVQAHWYQAFLRSQFERASGAPSRSDAFDRNARASHVSFQQTAPESRNNAIKKIEIPSIGLEAMVLEGDDEETLRLAVGHIPGTAIPSLSGNVGLAGHRDTFFRPLERIRVGDVIRVSTDDSQFQYRVASTLVVLPLNVEVLDDTPRPTLTLVTCYPFHYIGAAPKRFIVRAEMISAHAER